MRLLRLQRPFLFLAHQRLLGRLAFLLPRQRWWQHPANRTVTVQLAHVAPRAGVDRLIRRDHPAILILADVDGGAAPGSVVRDRHRLGMRHGHRPRHQGQGQGRQHETDTIEAHSLHCSQGRRPVP